MLEIKKVHEDVRGEIFEVLLGGNQIGAILNTNEGFARGGHYHPSEQQLYIVKGEFEYTTMELDKPETKKTVTLKEGDFITIPPKLIHLMTATKESVFFEAMPEGYSAINYEPFRKIVEEKMK